MNDKSLWMRCLCSLGLESTAWAVRRFHVRHYWKGKIECEVSNPEVDANRLVCDSCGAAYPVRDNLFVMHS